MTHPNWDFLLGLYTDPEPDDNQQWDVEDAAWEIISECAVAEIADVMLTHSVASIRTVAAWCLMMIGTDAKEAIPALLCARRDRDREVRGYATWALLCIAPEYSRVFNLGRLMRAIGEMAVIEKHSLEYRAPVQLSLWVEEQFA